jgi:hypothetical protein
LDVRKRSGVPHDDSEALVIVNGAQETRKRNTT